MDFSKGKKVLISGASIAGISTAYWLNRLGYQVTVVELASQLRPGGAAVNIGGLALDSIKRMGLLDQLEANRLALVSWTFRNEDDSTAGTMLLSDADNETAPPPDDDIEIERDKLVTILYNAVKDNVDFLFGTSITALIETEEAIDVALTDGSQRTYDLVFGCDGLHSGVRKIWFGHEAEYTHYLQHYFSLTIVNNLLIPSGTAQLYNTPGKVIMLNAYNQKTDVTFCFFSEKEIPYDYRNTEQQNAIITEQYSGQGWRTAELLDDVQHTKTAYFDKLCQVRMPSWTKGRVALVGDAGYCASPAAGRGASLAIAGAAAVADALEKHSGNIEAAFQGYNQTLRPFIEEVQDMALTILNEYLVPKTEAAIRERNTQTNPI